MKFFESVATLLSDAGIPQWNDTFSIEFSQKHTVHPLEGKLHEWNS
jgi:hypothetical protein